MIGGIARALGAIFVRGIAKVGATAIGVITNPAVRAMVAKQAATGTLKTAAAVAIWEGAALALEARSKKPDGRLQLSDGSTPRETTTADIENALRVAGLSPDAELTEENISKVAAAVRALGTVPEARIQAIEGELRAQLAAEGVAAPPETPSRGPAQPSQDLGSGELTAVASAMRRIAACHGREMAFIPGYLDDLATVTAASRDTVEAILAVEGAARGRFGGPYG